MGSAALDQPLGHRAGRQQASPPRQRPCLTMAVSGPGAGLAAAAPLACSSGSGLRSAAGGSGVPWLPGWRDRGLGEEGRLPTGLPPPDAGEPGRLSQSGRPGSSWLPGGRSEAAQRTVEPRRWLPGLLLRMPAGECGCGLVLRARLLLPCALLDRCQLGAI